MSHSSLWPLYDKVTKLIKYLQNEWTVGTDLKKSHLIEEYDNGEQSI